MISHPDIFETQEIQIVHSWLFSQDEVVKEAAAREVARLRVLETLRPFFSLLYMHSESKRKAALSGLRAPGVVAAFEVLNLDPEKFARRVEFEVCRLKTTRPDGFWRASGVGRPKGGKRK